MIQKRLTDDKGKGLMGFGFGVNASPHANTFRVLIIGPSNSGKTTMFANLIPDFPRPIKSITYIAPLSSQDDETPTKLKAICDKVGIIWTGINADDPIEMPNVEKPEIVIFDDLYKRKGIEPFVDEFAIRGRHEGRHVVYLTQSPAYVPSSIKNNCNHLILHGDFMTEDAKYKLHLDDMPEVGNERKFYIFKAGKYVKPYEPIEWKNTSNVYKVFKSIQGGKTPGGYRKLTKKEENIVKEGIALAGNKSIKSEAPIYKIQTEGGLLKCPLVPKPTLHGWGKVEEHVKQNKLTTTLNIMETAKPTSESDSKLKTLRINMFNNMF
jgi:hypothetical protein